MMLFFVFVLGMTGCKQYKNKSNPVEKPAGSIHRVYKKGPAVCIIDADKSDMTIADRLHLRITVIVDENYDVELPATGEKLAQFGIVDYHTTAPELTSDGKKKLGRSYVLEPFLSGKYIIPAMTVGFWKSGQKKKDIHTLQSEDIPITVKSLLPEKLKKMKLHDIRPPVSLPQSNAIWIVSGGIGATLIVIGLGIFLLVRKRRNAVCINAEPYLPPHERAYLELERLIAQKLIEQGEIKGFYYEISSIMRRYIENRFGIHAPEQTTEEFLAGLKTNTTFPAISQVLLKNFLTHCDLVKFAAHQPRTEDIQNTFDSCKKFISETKATDKDFQGGTG